MAQVALELTALLDRDLHYVGNAHGVTVASSEFVVCILYVPSDLYFLQNGTICMLLRKTVETLDVLNFSGQVSDSSIFR